MVDFNKELLKLRAKKQGVELEDYIAKLERVRDAAEAYRINALYSNLLALCAALDAAKEKK